MTPLHHIQKGLLPTIYRLPKLFTTCVQKTYIYENGKMRIEKFGKAVERSLNESPD